MVMELSRLLSWSFAWRNGFHTALGLVWFAMAYLPVSGASAQTAKIVGTGAIGCDGFTRAIDARPEAVREYFAWAQGYMSGALLRTEVGVDDGLDLSSRAMPIQTQIVFLQRYCGLHADRDFADAVHELYRNLGGKGM